MSVGAMIDSLTREEAEIMAARIFEEMASDTMQQAARGRRNLLTATREASQLRHLAIVLKRYAGA